MCWLKGVNFELLFLEMIETLSFGSGLIESVGSFTLNLNVECHFHSPFTDFQNFNTTAERIL